MIISMIVAADEGNAIGKNNAMIWHLPNDMKFFKATTTGHHIIMGRKNYDSIGLALPNRTSIVITRKTDLQIEGCLVVNDLKSALAIAKESGDDEAMIIGGGEIYKLGLELADKIYLTRVHHQFEGDAFFPELGDSWEEVSRDERLPDERHKYAYDFLTYTRK